MSEKFDKLIVVLEETPVAVVEEVPVAVVEEVPVAVVEEVPVAVKELISYFEKSVDDSIKMEKENIDIKQMEE